MGVVLGCLVLGAEVQRDGRGYNLCVLEDPDQTCTEEELLRKLPSADA
ncbi:hypothetical protein [Kitasatospora camelliae]|uniref:Uncharacterized protein n=1 Tax=Kitasatospora camelliae TaxID=3156397 RepID=A0AAU8K7H3_9ACTN